MERKVISLSLPVSSQNVEKKFCKTEECLAAEKYLKESMDLNVDPCDDFYLYACGNWSLSSDKYGNTISSIAKENDREIQDFLSHNNSNDEPEAVHKARKFFSLCKNKAAYTHSLKPIEIILQQIGLPVVPFISNETENYDYSALLGRAARFANARPYFDLSVSSSFYNQTENTIFLGKGIITDRRNTDRNYTEFMFNITERLCMDHRANSCPKLRDQFMFNEILNKNMEIANLNKVPIATLNSSAIDLYTLQQLQNLTDDIAAEVNATIPTLNWTRYIEEIFTDLDNVTLDLSDPNKVKIVIIELDGVKSKIRSIHKSPNTKIIALGLWWEVTLDLEVFTNSDNAKVDNCLGKTEEIFGMAVSYIYATKEKHIEAKKEIPTMFQHIRESFEQIINQTSWMDEITKQRALKKLQSMHAYIVYPSIIKTTPSFLNDIYKDVQITDNFYETIMSIYLNAITKNLKTINQINNDPRKVDESTLTPNIANAKYQYERNNVYIYAGLFASPIYYNGLHALNYGAIGFVIGHEMAHGFDNVGRRFNEIGNIENWWQPDTEIRYKENTKCFIKAYGNYSTTSRNITLMGDSKITIRDDFSDNTGFKEALLAYRKCVSVSGEEPFLPQFGNFSHEQLFTLAYANLWCKNPTVADVELSKIDSHSPDGVRVNGVLRNSKEFSEIWKCSKGKNMNPSDDKCTLW